jgi:hypothetical protein
LTEIAFSFDLGTYRHLLLHDCELISYCVLCCKPSGATKLRTTLLDKEYARITLEQKAALEGCEDITVAVDGWSNLRKESVYACNAITPARDMHLVAFDEVSVHIHDTTFLKGKVSLSTPHCCVYMCCSLRVASSCHRFRQK